MGDLQGNSEQDVESNNPERGKKRALSNREAFSNEAGTIALPTAEWEIWSVLH